jgi:hypothetical protein
MHYKRPVVDLDTGEKAWLELGDHLPLTDVAKELGIGPRRFRHVLLHMGILQKEWDERSRQHRHRLTPGAVRSGFGIRHDNKGFQYDSDASPFDVLSPVGVQYVRDHLSATLAQLAELPANVRQAVAALDAAAARRLTPMTPEMKVSWLTHRHPDLTAANIAKALGISEPLAHRYRSRRQNQIRRAEQASALAASWWPIQDRFVALVQAAAAQGDLLAGVEA